VPMRKLCLVLLASLLLVPAAAFAEHGTSGDGSLVVNNANARLTVSGHGLIFGHLDRGSITIVGDYKPDDNTALPSVSGAKLRFTGSYIVYSGTDVRFLFPAGRFVLILDGTGIDVSGVGTGKLTVVGKGFPDDGTVTVDGGSPVEVDNVLGTITWGKSTAGLAKARSGNGTG
jgi:hypothetical protein